MKVNALAALLRGERSDGALLPVYGEKTEAQKIRMSSLADIFSEKYGDMPEAGLFSVPGRIELSGNHTDHNRGRVIAGSVDLDIVAVLHHHMSTNRQVVLLFGLTILINDMDGRVL